MPASLTGCLGGLKLLTRLRHSGGSAGRRHGRRFSLSNPLHRKHGGRSVAVNNRRSRIQRPETEVGNVRSHRRAKELKPAIQHNSGDWACLFSLLLDATGVDFTHYKRTALLRRLRQRMRLHRMETLQDYLHRVQSAPAELEHLYGNLALRTARFFDDPQLFATLASQALPRLCQARGADDPLRVWIAGCSSGQEVYSFAITVLEYLWGSQAKSRLPAAIYSRPLQLFATAVNERTLGRARVGLYSKAETAGVSDDRLRRFFIRVNGDYQINNFVRELCVFARHNILRDLPFSRLDLISCRHLLTCLGPSLQERALSVLHHALKPGGFLIVEDTEVARLPADRFAPLDPTRKICQKIGPSPPLRSYFFAGTNFSVRRGGETATGCARGGPRVTGIEGQPVFGRLVPGRAALHQNSAAAKPESAATAISGENKFLGNEVAELQRPLWSHAEAHRTRSVGAIYASEEQQVSQQEIEAAREELQSVREELAALKEELDHRTVESSLANAEVNNLLSSVSVPTVVVNRDLRIRVFTASAERLLGLHPGDIGRRLAEIKARMVLEHWARVVRKVMETATPEEREVREKEGPWHLMRIRPLVTWGDRVDGAAITFQNIDALKRSLDETRRYADALIENAREPMLVLDSEMRVTVTNKAFCTTFQVSAEETENLRVYELGNGQWNIPALRGLLVNVLSANQQVEDFEVRHEFPHIGPRMMLLNARRIEPEPGRFFILLAIEDVTDRSAAQDALRRHAALLDLVHDAIFGRDLNGVIRFWSNAAERIYGWNRDQALGQISHELLRTVFPSPRQEVESEAIKSGRWEGELTQFRRDGSQIVVHSHWGFQPASELAPATFLEINSDITELKESESSLRVLSGRLIRAQDSERRRIALELHDTTGQNLVALKMHLNAAAAEVQPSSRAHQTISNCLELTDQVAREVRTLAYTVHPPLLDEAGLAAAIRWFADVFSRQTGLTVHFSVSPRFGRLPKETAIALFRVAQESLNNAHLHSGSRTARIQLSRTASQIVLEIRDGGRRAAELRPGLGILSMTERMNQAGGRLEIKRRSAGTTVRAVLPVQPSGGDSDEGPGAHSGG
jgi:PAS domain S-box-containing protein